MAASNPVNSPYSLRENNEFARLMQHGPRHAQVFANLYPIVSLISIVVASFFSFMLIFSFSITSIVSGAFFGGYTYFAGKTIYESPDFWTNFRRSLGIILLGSDLIAPPARFVPEPYYDRRA